MSGKAGGDREEYLIVARVRRPHGVRGEVLVTVETDRPKYVFRRDRTLWLGNDRGEPSGASVVVESARFATGGAILRIRDVTTRDAADELRGSVLLIEAADAQPAARGEIHFRDLVGLIAVADSGPIGTVEDILEAGGGELLVVRSADGRERLIPFVREIVRDIDLEQREMKLMLPDGFLEI